MYLNCHSYHSTRYGTIPLNELVQQAKISGLTSVALTDITVTGILRFYKTMQVGIKPIVGVEFRQNNRLLLLLAKTKRHWRNVSFANPS
jgi:DNA polymerase-3 subunit alpha/error-prone DNA polymerase